jgi:hypothetical protein
MPVITPSSGQGVLPAAGWADTEQVGRAFLAPLEDPQVAEPDMPAQFALDGIVGPFHDYAPGVAKKRAGKEKIPSKPRLPADSREPRLYQGNEIVN